MRKQQRRELARRFPRSNNCQIWTASRARVSLFFFRLPFYGVLLQKLCRTARSTVSPISLALCDLKPTDSCSSTSVVQTVPETAGHWQERKNQVQRGKHVISTARGLRYGVYISFFTASSSGRL